MELFFIKPEDICGEFLYIRNSEAHHIKDVLRYKEGDNLSLFDGEGGLYRGEVVEIKGKEIKVKILDREKKKKKPPFFHLVQAIPKKGKMDLIVEKVAELGIDEITPVITERTVARLSEEKEKKLKERWNKIALAAVKQSKRFFVPTIKEIKTFSQALDELRGDSLLLIPHLGEKNLMLKQLDWAKYRKNDIFMFIGPEGDFTPEEITLAKRKGAISVSLGEAVLRSETAAIYLLSVLNYELR